MKKTIIIAAIAIVYGCVGDEGGFDGDASVSVFDADDASSDITVKYRYRCACYEEVEIEGVSPNSDIKRHEVMFTQSMCVSGSEVAPSAEIDVRCLGRCRSLCEEGVESRNLGEVLSIVDCIAALTEEGIREVCDIDE